VIENSFQAARYLGGDHIAAHDDKYALLLLLLLLLFSVGSHPASRAFKTIDDEVYSRELAVIYYLTDDWKEEYGGTRRASHHSHRYFGCVGVVFTFNVDCQAC
jgi:Rps23 Pro-64 3,4-dihydroxylase Tpa1-like proline 4-hydroxylase